MPRKFRVRIDPREECISCGSCWSLCPEVFEMNEDDGLSQIVEKYRAGGLGEGEVPGDLEECVKSAEEACPVTIIHVEEVEE